MKNPYRKKRNKTTIIYLLTMAAAFLLGMGMIGLNELTGVKLFYTLGMIFTMIDALGMILLVPLLIRIVKLTKQAKMHDEAQAAPPDLVRTVTDSVGEEQTESRAGRIGYHYARMYDREMGPWWSAILLILVLPPLGAVLSFLKAYREPQNSLSNALMLSSAGYVLTGLGAAVAIFFALVGADDPAVVIKLMILPACILIIGVLMLWYASVLNKKGRLIARVQKLVWMDAVLNIDELGIQMKMTYGDTVAMLQKLIDEGFLYTCYLDFAAREIISTVQLRKTAKKCRHCGGTTTFIDGTAAVCDYCGRFLK